MKKEKKQAVSSQKQDKKDTATHPGEHAIEELQQTIASLERKLGEAEEITKRAQSDYFRLKMDMDAYSERVEQQKKLAKQEAFISACKGILPFVSQLKNTIAAASDEMKSHKRYEGVELVYTKTLAQLQQQGVTPIESVHCEPDLSAHMPLGTEPVDDKSLKGKIVKELEQGYRYSKDDVDIIIIPAKVIVGS